MTRNGSTTSAKFSKTPFTFVLLHFAFFHLYNCDGPSCSDGILSFYCSFNFVMIRDFSYFEMANNFGA